MQFGGTEFYLIILIGVIAYASWKTHEVQSKIYCEFLRSDNTTVNKFASFKQAKIVFDGAWYDVDTNRIIGKVWKEGFPFYIFPTRGAKLLYKYNSRRPLDPETFENSWEDDPEVRAALDKKDDIQAYNEGNRKSVGVAGKKTMFEQYLPIIVIGGFLVIGYFVYTLQGNVDRLGAGQNAIQGLIGELLKK